MIQWFSKETTRVDLQSLALFRMAFSILLLADFFFNIAPNYDAFFGAQGLLPSDLWRKRWNEPGVVSLINLSAAPSYQLLLQILYVGAAFCFLIGYRTFPANLVLLVIYVSFYWRNPLLNSNAETLVRCFLVWCLFLPMNRYWSVDAALETQPRRRPTASIPVYALKAQISTVYFFSGLFKVAGAKAWLGGPAVEMALRDGFYGSQLGAAHAMIFHPYVHYMGYAVTFFQLSFTFLVYSPFFNRATRSLAILGAALMHLSFIFFLQVGLFPYLCVTYLLLLVPDGWWDGLLAKRRKRLGAMRVFYDTDCGFCRKTALLLREFCLPAQVPVEAASTDAEAERLLRLHHSWVVYGADGQLYLKWRAVAYVMQQSWVFWPFGAWTDLPFLRGLMEKLYDGIGANRALLGKITSFTLPWRQEKNVDPIGQFVCFILVLIMVSDTAAVMPQINKVPAFLRELSSLFEVEQKWNIFAPTPSSNAYRYSFLLVLKDSRVVNLGDRVNLHYFVKPEFENYVFEQHRWLKYFSWLTPPKYTDIRRAFANYYCRLYNEAARADADHAVKLELHLSVAVHEEYKNINHEQYTISESYDCP